LNAASAYGSLFYSNIIQYTAASQYFMEPPNQWSNSYAAQNQLITQDINTEAFYYGAILLRQQEREKYSQL